MVITGWIVNVLNCFFSTIKNTADALPLTPRHAGPWGFFRRARVIVGGQVLQDTDMFNRITHMFLLLNSAERSLNDLAMGFGISGESIVTLDNQNLSESISIAAGTNVTAGLSLFIRGLFNQTSFLPVPCTLR